MSGTLRRPPALPQGGTLGLVAPASPGSSEAVERGIEAIRALGFRTVLGAHVWKRRGHLAGSDADRTADLEGMLLRDGIDAVMCLRGGSGSIRLLRRLDWNRIAAHPRLFIGYSDVTAIELALLACCRIPSIFGPMVASEFSRGVDRESVKLLERLAMVPHAAGLLGDARCAGASTLRGGVAEGPLVGGTLSLLVSVLGTPYLPCLAGAILFIEDVHESPARIERYLAHLQMTGILDGVSGVLVGSLSFEATDEERGHYLPFPQVLEDMLAPLNVPVVFDWPTGHLRSPLPLPQGVRVRLDADARTLEVLEPLVC